MTFNAKIATKLISENNHWMNQSFYGHWFISANIFTDFTSKMAETTDFSVNAYTTDWFSENLIDLILESSYFIKYKSRRLILQTNLIHIPLNDMNKSHMKKTKSFDSRFRYDKLLIITWEIHLQIILNWILYLHLIK